MKIADLFVKLGLKDRDFKKGIDGAERRTNKFGDAMKRIGGVISGVFAVGQILRFTNELIKLGGEAEGVRQAFNRIADDRILRNLQEATAGTVSQLELMKRAVSASNLGLPVENLASLFEFATKRAQETGESVDYLVNSIVTGIGRKSPLILDNLGISAIQLREKLKGVGMETASTADIAKAVGEIAADSMRESGKVIDSNTIKMANLNAQWEDFKVNLAESDGFAKTVSGSLTELQQVATIAFAQNISGWQKFTTLLFGSTDKWEKLSGEIDEFNKRQLEIAEVNAMYEKMYEKAKNPLGGKGDGGEEKIKSVSDRIAELSKEIKIQQSLITKDAPYKSVIDAIDRVKELESELKKLNDAFPNVTQRVGAMQPMTGQSVTPQVGETMAPVPSGLADMSGFLEQNAEKTKQYTADMLEKWDTFGQQLSETIQSGAVDAIAEFSTLIGELFSGSVNGESFFNSILGQMGRFLSTLGKMIIAYGVAMEAFQASLKNIFSGVGALGVIAAGAALVAIGGGIASYASRAGSGGGASGATGAQRIFNASNFPTGEGGMELNVTGVLQGDNLLISNQRSAYRRKIIG